MLHLDVKIDNFFRKEDFLFGYFHLQEATITAGIHKYKTEIINKVWFYNFLPVQSNVFLSFKHWLVIDTMKNTDLKLAPHNPCELTTWLESTVGDHRIVLSCRHVKYDCKIFSCFVFITFVVKVHCSYAGSQFSGHRCV